MWSGAQVDIPTGWLLCNGANGTPNLLDRFVIGAGNSYAVGATGGNKDAIVPAHTHTATLGGSTAAAGSHSHGVNDPGHAHGYNTAFSPVGGAAGSDLRNGWGTYQTGSATTGISLNAASDHTHTLSAAGTTDSTGVSATNANLPPYYALCFIQKSA
jgi:hypothetical protein